MINNQETCELSTFIRRDPITTSSDELLLERFRDTAQVIEQLHPDYPVYCFCPDQLDKRVKLFVNNFPGKVGFAVKANGESVVLSHLTASGIHFFDAASIREIELLIQIDPDAIIFYDNPVKSEHEIEQAYFKFGVRCFALDDDIELNKIRSVIGNDPMVQLNVRFKIPGSYAIQDLSTKFGADEHEATTLLTQVNKAGYGPALTFHPGSQCICPSAYKDYIETAARIACNANINISMLNVGGGFPVQYRDSSIPPLSDFFEVVETQFNKWFSKTECVLACEPGRSLVASSSSLLCRVKHRRKDKTIFLNDGIYGGFMEQFVTFFKLPMKVYRNSNILLDESVEFKVFGPTCDSADCFKESVFLPASIAAGDWIEFGLTGAYGSATTTRFNGYSSDYYVIVEQGSHFAN